MDSQFKQFLKRPDFESDLWFLARTTGLQFLGRTYDIIENENDYILRIVVEPSGELAGMDTVATRDEVISLLREELELALMSHLTGRMY